MIQIYNVIIRRWIDQIDGNWFDRMVHTGTSRDFNARENPAEIFSEYFDRRLTKIPLIWNAICV